jgi:hypothetical protein
VNAEVVLALLLLLDVTVFNELVTLIASDCLCEVVKAEDCEDIDREGALRGERAGRGGDEGVGGETGAKAVVVVVIGGKSTMRPERGVSAAVE